MILGLFWCLITKYQISGDKAELIDLLRREAAPYNLEVDSKLTETYVYSFYPILSYSPMHLYYDYLSIYPSIRLYRLIIYIRLIVCLAGYFSVGLEMD